ncbi:hypothetical protein BBP40_008753 [Aspergillus hancockii]|nr:hypothetical protein BBP40_008753 [Aspergillus hancockii]
MSPKPFKATNSIQLNDPSLLHEASLLNGEWVDAQSSRRSTLRTQDPGMYSHPARQNGPEDVDKYVETSHAAFARYRQINSRERAKFLLTWHELITNARENIATIVVYETGKPMAEALGEVDYALGFAWWFAGEAERVRGSIATPSVSNRRTFFIKQPIGVSIALVPWNFPVAMIVRKVAAALAAGCTMIVKPSPETPLSVMAVAGLALRAGLAPGVLNVITTDNEYTPPVSERLCKHPLVRKVTFTGSTRGGTCPFIVVDDGDLEQAVAALMILKWRTAGQACTHANRVYVQAGVYDKLARMMLEATQKLRVGHGANPTTTMGPLTTDRGIEKLERQGLDRLQLPLFRPHPGASALYQQVLMVLSLFNSITRPDAMLWYANTRFYHIVDLTGWQVFPCTKTLNKVHRQYRPTEVQLRQQYPQVIDWLPFPTIRNRLIQFHAANLQIDQIFCDTVSSYVIEACMSDLVMGAPAITAYIRVTDVIANIPSTTPGSELDPSAVLPASDLETLFHRQNALEPSLRSLISTAAYHITS